MSTSSSSTSSYPRWYSHLYPAVNCRKHNEKWPPLTGETGRLLGELKTKIEKKEIPRGDASKYLLQYKKEVASLMYRPSKRDLDFEAHYKEDMERRMLPSSLSLRWMEYPLVAFAPTEEDVKIAKEYASYEERSWLPHDFFAHHW